MEFTVSINSSWHTEISNSYDLPMDDYNQCVRGWCLCSNRALMAIQSFRSLFTATTRIAAKSAETISNTRFYYSIQCILGPCNVSKCTLVFTQTDWIKFYFSNRIQDFKLFESNSLLVIDNWMILEGAAKPFIQKLLNEHICGLNIFVHMQCVIASSNLRPESCFAYIGK